MHTRYNIEDLVMLGCSSVLGLLLHGIFNITHGRGWRASTGGVVLDCMKYLNFDSGSVSTGSLGGRGKVIGDRTDLGTIAVSDASK
jgi:hypothetical protein